MTWTARLALRCMAFAFALGAIGNMEADPFLAGMLTVLCVVCIVVAMLSRLVSVTRESLFPPTPERIPMAADDDQVKAWATDIVGNIEEFGAFRFDGDPQVLCPICRTWCKVNVITLNGEPPIGGLTIGTKDKSALTEIHVDVTMHVHDHECPGANTVLLGLTQAIAREGRE